MLTTVNYGLASGIRNVEWDAVELPSQFMENWCYHDTLLGLSGHVDTGEPLPDDLYEKICAARNYRAGSQMLRQLYFAFLDLALHHNFDPHGRETIFQVQERIAKMTTVLPPLPEDRFLCSFGHIFLVATLRAITATSGQKCSAPTLLAPSRKRGGGCEAVASTCVGAIVRRSWPSAAAVIPWRSFTSFVVVNQVQPHCYDTLVWPHNTEETAGRLGEPPLPWPENIRALC